MITTPSRFLVAFLLACASSTALSQYEFTDGFESGDSPNFDESHYNPSGNRPTPSRDYARVGSWSMKSEINRPTARVTKRTEVTLQQSAAQIGDEVWYGFSIFIPPDYVVADTWEILAQWHDAPNTYVNNTRANPPLYVGVEKRTGKWKIVNLDSPNVDTFDPSNPVEPANYKSWLLDSVVPGTWTDFVFKIKWEHTPGRGGLLQIWKNGALVVDYAGPNCYNDNLGPYFKMGVYRGWGDAVNPPDVTSNRTVYHDELRIRGAGSSYEDVAPGGGGNCCASNPPQSPPQPSAPEFVSLD